MCLQLHNGPVAHLVEHIICNDGVAGSSPVGSTKYKKVCLVADFFDFVEDSYVLLANKTGESGSREFQFDGIEITRDHK